MKKGGLSPTGDSWCEVLTMDSRWSISMLSFFLLGIAVFHFFNSDMLPSDCHNNFFFKMKIERKKVIITTLLN